MRLIDADALWEEVFKVWGIETDGGEMNLFMEMINNSPTISLPPNDPLTLEELREMNGDPVWVSWAGHSCEGWALVRVWSRADNIIYLTYPNLASDLLKFILDNGARVYRRKPEEGME